MKRLTIVLLVATLTGCARQRSVPPSFPPTDSATLQRFAEHFVPSIEIIPSGDTLHAERVQRTDTTYQGLYTYFIAYSCKPHGAERLLRSDHPLDNSILVDATKMTIETDPEDGKRMLTIRPPDMTKTSVFPDVLYENLDLSRCDTLRIRTNSAPQWYRPDLMSNGLADRCSWDRGRVLTEFYFDADRELMYMRIEERRPD